MNYYFTLTCLHLLFQSETCSLELPDLEFEMGGFALGGRFTTLEGLLNNMSDQIDNNPIMGASIGDSSDAETKAKIEAFKARLKELVEVKKPYTIILDDPAGNSYIQVWKSYYH